MSFRVEENGQFRGQVVFLDAVLNAGCVGNDQVSATDPIEASKLEHQHRGVYAQESGTTASAESRVVHVVHGSSGRILAFAAGMVSPCSGDATVTVDLHKNGSSVLVSAITLDSDDEAYGTVAATIDDDSLTSGDVLEVVVSVNAGTGALGQGVFAYVDVREDYD